VTPTLASMLVAALVVGVLIGWVGIGGVLMTPALVYVGSLGFHLAAATSMWAFLFCGAAGTLIYCKRGSVDWRLAVWLGAGVVPTAFAGAWANVALPEGVLMALLAALMGSGVEHGYSSRRPTEETPLYSGFVGPHSVPTAFVMKDIDPTGEYKSMQVLCNSPRVSSKYERWVGSGDRFSVILRSGSHTWFRALVLH
jgi:uncharacterized membrane protein YfcA